MRTIFFIIIKKYAHTNEYGKLVNRTYTTVIIYIFLILIMNLLNVFFLLYSFHLFQLRRVGPVSPFIRFIMKCVDHFKLFMVYYFDFKRINIFLIYQLNYVNLFK